MNYCSVGRYKYVTIYKMIVGTKVTVSFDLEDNEKYPVEYPGFWESLPLSEIIIEGSEEYIDSILTPLGCIYEVRNLGKSFRCKLYDFPDFELYKSLGYFS